MNIQIPSGITALSISAPEFDLKSGDQLKEDWYQYRDGKRLRKWVGGRPGWNNFWPACIKDLARIERLYRQARARYMVRWNRQMKMAAEIMEVAPKFSDVFWAGCTIPNYGSRTSWQPFGGPGAKIVSAIPTHLVDKNPDARWLFEFYPASEHDLEHGLNPVQTHFAHCRLEDLPPEGVLPELGQRFYRAYYAAGKCWAGKLNPLLNEALLNYAHKNLPPPQYVGHTRSYRLVINGRTYYLSGKRDRKDWTTFSIVSTPDDEDCQTMVVETKRQKPSLLQTIQMYLDQHLLERFMK